MQRPIEPAEPHRWALVMVPDDPNHPIREMELDESRLRRWRFAALSTLGIAIVLVLALAVTWPRSAAYPTLFEENMELRERLSDLERKMQDAEGMLARLRLYDAQLRSLADADGDHGPLPESAMANSSILQVYGDLREHAEEVEWELDGSVDGMPLDELANEVTAVQWAADLQGRVDGFTGSMTALEPGLNALMEDAEVFRSIERALPSQLPAAGRLTSGFGYRRHPFGGRAKFHAGLDVANRRGTPIHAAQGGVIKHARTMSGYGRTVVIDHGHGITTLYAHCTRLTVGQGQVVEAGDMIATMGSTGRSTGPHLHFELRFDGQPVDPLAYLQRD